MARHRGAPAQAGAAAAGWSTPARRTSALAAAVILALLAGCASGPRGGRDGPGTSPPTGLERVPDAVPRVETIRRSGGTSKPYTVLGRSYVPITDDRPVRERGLASWYGRKFHGERTASGEPYDMYAMTAAHKTLPLPSYARVRNPANGREIIVRVNDRGPFHDGRIIDLSYTAALQLDLLRGVAPVEIERLTNEQIAAGTWRREGDGGGTALAQQAPAQQAPSLVTPPASVQPADAMVFAPLPALSAPVAVADARAASAPSSAPTSASAVPVPLGLTSPVVDIPRTEVHDLPPLEPLAPPGPAPAPPPAPVSPPLPAPPQADAPASARSAHDPEGLSGFWVQLGAFSQPDGVERFRQQIARDLPPLGPSLTVFAERGTYRLQAGPYASRDLARETAESVRNGLGLVPMVVERP